MQVYKLTKSQFDEMLADTHTCVFGGELPLDFFRYDCAYVLSEQKDFIGYALVREMSGEDVELSYGGLVEEHRSKDTKNYFYGVLGRAKEDGYKFAHIQVKNDNLKMLRLALSVGFLVTGFRQSGEQNKLVLMTLNLGGEK
jgi:hypothetical protein